MIHAQYILLFFVVLFALGYCHHRSWPVKWSSRATTLFLLIAVASPFVIRIPFN